MEAKYISDAITLAVATMVAGGMTAKELGTYIKAHSLLVSRQTMRWLVSQLPANSFQYDRTTKKYTIVLAIVL
jgi:hypothetical protein